MIKQFTVEFFPTHICLLVVEDHPVSCQVEPPLLAPLELGPVLISKNFLLLFDCRLEQLIFTI